MQRKERVSSHYIFIYIFIYFLHFYFVIIPSIWSREEKKEHIEGMLLVFFLFFFFKAFTHLVKHATTKIL